MGLLFLHLFSKVLLCVLRSCFTLAQLALPVLWLNRAERAEEEGNQLSRSSFLWACLGLPRRRRRRRTAKGGMGGGGGAKGKTGHFGQGAERRGKEHRQPPINPPPPGTGRTTQMIQ